MKLVRDTQFCVTNWSALKRREWPNMVACAKQTGPIRWSWPKRFTPLSVKCLIKSAETYELPHRTVTVDQDSYLIINEGTEYASHIDSNDDVETASVFITSELCSEVLATMNMSNERLIDADLQDRPVTFVERLYPRDDKLISILTNIHSLTNSTASDLQLQQQMYVLTEHLLLLHERVNQEIHQLQFSRASTREEIYKRLHICRDYMASNLDRTLALDELATVAGFAPHHLLRMFKEVFDSTPHKYLMQLRLVKARQLVLNTNKQITEICASVGFESVTSFSALYKRNFLVSPLQDRQSKGSR
jgi:AraC family transcriptional regulator